MLRKDLQSGEAAVPQLRTLKEDANLVTSSPAEKTPPRDTARTARE